MARKEKIEAEVEFRPKGLGELKAKWADFAGDLLEPMVMLAAGATKAQAAWAGMRGIFESRVLGPLGLVAGASVGFLLTTKTLIGQWRTLGMAASGALERMTLQFRPLLGSMDRARERVKQLQTFAVKTPFEIDEIVEANKMLETLTQGALANEKGMTLVGDAASVAGQSFADTSRQVGRLYDGLMSGRPVGEATMRLQEMGILSGTVRNQIESMQAANVNGLEIWKVVEKQLQRNTGAMDAQSRSLEGLQSTWNDTKNQMEGGFSSGFLEGEKSGVEASIKMMEAMTPVMQSLGQETGAVENKWEALKLKVVEGVTSWKGFGTTVEWIIKSMVGLAAVLAGASTAAILGFTVNILKLMAGNKAAAASAEYLAKVESASIPATAKLVAIKNALQAANRANAAGMRAEAAAQLGAAAAGMKNLATTNGLVGVVGLGRKAMQGLGMAVGFVATQMRAMAVAILANPMVWLAAAVAGLVAAFSKWSAVQQQAKERLEGYQKATSALQSSMQKQIADIRTLVDLRQAESKILSELVGAYKAVEGAQNSADKKAAEDRVGMLKDRLKSLPGTGGLEKTDAQMAMEQRLREGALQAREYERDSIAAKGPEESLKVAEQRLDELNQRRKEAIDLVNEENAVEERGAQRRQASFDPTAQRQALLARKAQLEETIAGYDAADKNTPDFGLNQALSESSRRELERVKDELFSLADGGDGGSLAEMLASPSELQQLKARIAVLDELKAATDALADAQDALAQNTEKDKASDLGAAVVGAKDAAEKAQRLAEQAGVTGMDARGRQEMVRRRDELEARRAEDMDPAREAQLAKERRDAELALATAKLDAAAAVESLRLRGFEREQRLLQIEEEKLRMRRQAEAIGQDEYDRQRAMLAERQASLQRETAERRTELNAAYEISKLRRAEDEARRNGDPRRAERMRQAAEAREDERTRREAERDAREVTADPAKQKNYADNLVAEARAAREQERRREEADRARGRERSRADVGSGEAAMQAELLRRQGKTREARAIVEKAARRQDALDRQEAAKRYRDQGFTGGEADRLAGRDEKLSRANRMMDLLGRGNGAVVADSLASVAGGGGVSGRDTDTELLRRIEQVLRSIDKKTGETDFSSDY